jgi:hypothetical protein
MQQKTFLADNLFIRLKKRLFGKTIAFFVYNKTAVVGAANKYEKSIDSSNRSLDGVVCCLDVFVF